MSKLRQALNTIKSYKENPAYKASRIKAEIASKIEEILVERGLSKSQFARSINASNPYVTKMLRGDANMTIETMVKAATALDHELTVCFSPKKQATPLWVVDDRVSNTKVQTNHRDIRDKSQQMNNILSFSRERAKILATEATACCS